jgi:hypothetical protein
MDVLYVACLSALCARSLSMQHNTTVVAIGQYLSALNSMCKNGSRWVQHHKNRFTGGQMCMSLESRWGDTRSQKDKTLFYFKACLVFSTGNSQEFCGPNHDIHLLM